MLQKLLEWMEVYFLLVYSYTKSFEICEPTILKLRDILNLQADQIIMKLYLLLEKIFKR